jgi:hypothetical protein
MRAIDARWCSDTGRCRRSAVLRTSLVSPACLISLVISELSVACPVMGEPTVEALVDAGLSSIRTPLRLTVYRRDDDPSGGVCIASLDLALSELPSRRLVPRPRELADAVARSRRCSA